MRTREKERGSALVFILLAMLSLVFFITALLTMSRTETMMANHQYRKTAAFYLAEGGLQMAAARLEEEPSYRGNFFADWEREGRVDVKVQEEEEGMVQVTSQGAQGGAKSRLVAKLRVVDHTLLSNIDEIIVSKGSFRINTTGAQKDLPVIEGRVLCSGIVSTPEAYEALISQDNFTFPEIGSLAAYQRELGGEVLTPAQLAGNRNLAGVSYVAGDVMLASENDGIAGEGILLIDGHITIAEPAAIEGVFVLMASEGIYWKGTARVEGLFYTPGPFLCQSEGDTEIVGKIWSGEGVCLGGAIKIKDYPGDRGELLGELPPALVSQEIWYSY